jgi:hypothetical protein
VILGFVFHPPWAGGSSSKSNTTTSVQENCPADVEGRITHLSIEPQPIPLAAYWQLNPDSRPAHPSKARARSLGRIVEFDVVASNYRGKELGVWWWMLNASGEPVPEPTLQRQLAFAVRPGSCKKTPVTRDFWAELPKRPGRYRVLVRLYVGDEQLNARRTKIFTVASLHH